MNMNDDDVVVVSNANASTNASSTNANAGNIVIENTTDLDIQNELNTIINNIAYQLNENKELDGSIERNKKIMKKIKKIQENMKKRLGIVDENTFVIPTKEQFLSSNNKYNIAQLKDICKHYKQKISGTKKELIERIESYFKKNDCIKTIQRLCRTFIYKKFKKLHGPARMNRSLCVNETDFYTMEPIKDIHYSQFFSFKDKDGMIYGFDIMSLYTLLANDIHKEVTNPYNRKLLPVTLMRDLKRLIRMSKILKHDVVMTVEEEVKEMVCPRKEMELLSISLFQYIDQLGNYTDPTWFWSLGNRQLVRFLHELNDIWCYRSQLTHQMKRDICPPFGNPFVNVPINMVTVHLPLFELKRIALNVIEQMIKRGISTSNRSLGANYVLCALTLVSPPAAAAIPWLYESVAHF